VAATVALAAGVGFGDEAACAVPPIAECLLQVERLRRKIIGTVASRVNIKS